MYANQLIPYLNYLKLRDNTYIHTHKRVWTLELQRHLSTVKAGYVAVI
jgi:hypothetical protein